MNIEITLLMIFCGALAALSVCTLYIVGCVDADINSGVEERLTQWPDKPHYAGSIPASATSFNKAKMPDMAGVDDLVFLLMLPPSLWFGGF